LPNSAYQIKAELLRDLGNLYSRQNQIDKAESAYKLRLHILESHQNNDGPLILDIGIAL
jgi:hypothetical protein